MDESPHSEGTPSFELAPAWGIPSQGESRWPARLAVVVAVALQLVLPDRVSRGLGPRWLIPALELVLLVILVVVDPERRRKESRLLRNCSIGLIGIITLANLLALAELLHALLSDASVAGRPLVYASVPIWLTNVIVFGLWYWEMDRGGVAARHRADHRAPDFLFPQMTTPAAAPGWSPSFLDYLYTAFTNATAFSPTDTMPLSGRAKLLMMLQSLASVLTVTIVVSRAINILG